MRPRQPSRKQASNRGIYLRSALVCLVAAAALSLAAFASGRRIETPARNAPDQATPGAPNTRATPGTPIDAQFKGKLPISELSEEEAAAHALNRLGYGPRPGDIEQIKQMGLEKWIDLQLHPERLDDSRLQARLQQFPTLGLSAGALLNEYPRPEDAAKREGISIDEYRKRTDALAHPPQGIRPAPSMEPQEVLSEAQQAKVLRTLYSERQLEQQLTDFWFNHFNVFAYKDLDQWFLEPYERDAIRPHVLGKFRDLLEATARSPAMLFYLDNYLSADPQSFDRLKHLPPGKRPRPDAKLPPLGGKRGLNENYGRELLELHTLGVDGGYTQQDVVEVARSFTGWTIRDLRTKPEFYFDDRIHDPDSKRVLGKKIHAGGIKDGEQVLDLLVKNPRTAHHIAFELAQHFVSDTPPEALVQRMAKGFQKSNGDVREVVRTMIYSPEFWSRTTYRAKVKRPFELVASTARALGADVDDAGPLVGWVGRIGEPLYQCQPPTGYSDKSDAWVNTGALLNRLNYAIALASNRVRGSQVQLTPLLGSDAIDDPYQALDRAMNTFLVGQASETTRATLEREASDPKVAAASPGGAKRTDLGVITGLVLGAPEFQRR